MNHISKIHQRFSKYLNDPRVLTNPQEFLGPNYKEVMNFWIILDDLSEEQFEVVNKREEDFFNEIYPEWKKATYLTCIALAEVVSEKCVENASQATYDVTNSSAADWATIELIAMHKILEDHQQSLTIFPMFLEVL